MWLLRPERIGRWLTLAFIGFGAIHGAVLPARLYTTSDGLIRNAVQRIKRDSHGYLWLATNEGLSLFDGYQFTNLTDTHHRGINDLIETRAGEYWLATNEGLCRYRPNPTPAQQRFTLYPLRNRQFYENLTTLLEDSDGSIWCGGSGLRRSQVKDGVIQVKPIELPSPAGSAEWVRSLMKDRRGILWVGAEFGLYLIWPDGRISRFTTAEGLPSNRIRSLLEDRERRIWIGTEFGLARAVDNPQVGRRIVSRIYNRTGTPDADISAIFESSDGQLWAGLNGIFEFRPNEESGRQFRRAADGLDMVSVNTIAEDADHNLWAGTEHTGAARLARYGFTNFHTSDGLRSLAIRCLTESRAGEVIAVTGAALQLQRLDRERFVPFDPVIPSGLGSGWSDRQTIFQDQTGEWWIAAGKALLRYDGTRKAAGLAGRRPKAIYGRSSGLTVDAILNIFEDSRGDVWIGGYWAGGQVGVARWNRKTGRVREFTNADGLRLLAPPRVGMAMSMAEDQRGEVWIGYYPYGLARFRGTHFDWFSESDGIPGGEIHNLVADRSGRLWIATAKGGLGRIDDPAAEKPVVHRYTREEGLSSNQVFAVAEDLAGQIFVADGRGVDRLDPASGRFAHFTTADGLPLSETTAVMCDRRGNLWFGSSDGLSRYTPPPEQLSQPGTPLLRKLTIAGAPYNLSDFGAPRIEGLELKSDQNNLQIEFASLHFGSSETLQYQYRLDGADNDWSVPTPQRAVNYSRLAAGHYRFLVRSVNSGKTSDAASIGFTIQPPVWLRGWFFLLCGTVLTTAAYLLHSYRLRQIIAIERIRTRLASDLHDDIGAGLAEIAIRSEVAQVSAAQNGDAMQQIATRARQLREAMSDIVWSVNPRHDHIEGLVMRIRQTVFSTLENNGRTVNFVVTDPILVGRLELSPERRREVLLMTKEIITNIAVHSQASAVAVSVTGRHGVLELEFSDNGTGFDRTAPQSGMGLFNLNQRATSLGAELVIHTEPGKGTQVTIAVPAK